MWRGEGGGGGGGGLANKGSQTAKLPGLASAPRAPPLADRGFVEEGLPELWAAAAAAANVARFCSCSGLTPEEQDQQRDWVSAGAGAWKTLD